LLCGVSLLGSIALLGCCSVCGGGTMFRCSTLLSGCPMRSLCSLCCVRAMCCSCPLCRLGPLRCRSALCGLGPLRRSRAVLGWRAIGAEMTEDQQRAAEEIAFTEAILKKSGDTVLSETLKDTQSVAAWSHYPPGDVFDPASGGQWYYHCHQPAADAVEHGHFHCFVRPDGAKGPVHHLIGVGVDGFGKLHRLFTVNQWVVGDNWLDAEPTIALLPRFDVHMARPSYLVNRWLTAVVRRYEPEIAELIRARDHRLAARTDTPALLADKSLEVTSELLV
jgi:hypothetical protein